MGQENTSSRRYTVASLVIADHPFFEGRNGSHNHLVACRICLTITLESGDIRYCQTCGLELIALEKDLIGHLAEWDWQVEP
jgi:hypothetical protein